MAFLVFDWAVYRSQHPWVRSLRAYLSRRTESCLKVFATNRSLLAHETELPPPPPGFNVPGTTVEHLQAPLLNIKTLFAVLRRP
jgi:hypothetical protein